MNSIHNILVSIHQYIYPRSKQKSKELKIFEIQYSNRCEICKRNLGFKERNIVILSDETGELSSLSELAYKIEDKYQIRFQSDEDDFSDGDVL